MLRELRSRAVAVFSSPIPCPGCIGYLTHCLRPDPASYELAREMRSEMSVAGKKVSAFITHYCEFGANDDNHARFIGELQGIGEALTGRIGREENSPYTLHLPPDAYDGR